jgi:transaldolase / glucose-6-phosphate isomerase
MSPEAHPTGSLALRASDDLQAIVTAAIARAVDQRWASRLAARDTSIWTTDEHVAATIANRLGWLDAPITFRDEIAELEAFAAGLRQIGVTDVIVCGMGGSSLAPEVLAAVFPRSATGLPVRVLDSTDPAAVRAIEEASDPGTTIRIIATKSGTTTETLAFLAHFWELQVQHTSRFHRSEAGDSFVAITDPGASLEAIPHSEWFRESFLNPADVGGRYSALTYVGLVPAALLGLDLTALLDDAGAMLSLCGVDAAGNPGVALGAAIGALALAGRDKLTFVIEPDLAPLGAWLEQLIAESTGKSGTGVVPVDGEPLGAPGVYGADRVFVRLGRPSHTSESDAPLAALAAAGHPVIDVPLTGGSWVGAEFVRWEVATAIAGAVLGVDPFDEPNVTESKHNTRTALEQHAHSGAFPAQTVSATTGALQLIADASLAAQLDATPVDATSVLRAHLGRVSEHGYHAIDAYIATTPERTASLRRIQALLRDGTSHATTLGYGPRFLHSTGQLHKGGTPSGCFLQLVSGHPDDLPIPGRSETFGVLIEAQALGDLASLATHGLPALRVHLSDDPDTGLEELETLLAAALA